jgi:GT2 family glycosyltransferase
VSIIVPFRDQATLLKSCVETLLAKTTYRNFELLGIDNGSQEAATHDAIRHLDALDDRIAFHRYDVPFNYSRINNHAVTLARGQHLILLNNDIEIIAPDWIEALLEHSQRIEVGAVGGRLYYPNGKVQHGGVIVGIAGFAGHAHRHWPKAGRGYFNRLSIVQNLSAVTGAMLMVERALYLELGGLDEDHLGTSLNDVDFCLRLRERGYLNVYTPYAEAYHHESVSRGYEITPEKQRRFADEIAYFQRRHQRILAQGDPYYNPNLTLNFEDFGYGEDTFGTDKRYGLYRNGSKPNGLSVKRQR